MCADEEVCEDATARLSALARFATKLAVCASRKEKSGSRHFMNLQSYVVDGLVQFLH